MAIQVDNAVIDYSTITDIVQKLTTHDDQFAAFTSGSLLSSYDAVTTQSLRSPASSTLLATVKYDGKFANSFAQIPLIFGATFSNAPHVTVTVKSSNTSLTPIAFISDVTTTSVTVVVKELSTKTATSSFTLYVHAIGQRGI